MAISAWILAARPKTLAAGIVPVAVGVALAGSVGPINWLAAAACFSAALLIQVATNYANDAFDALKGADASDRLGPKRAVASGLITARAMLAATAVLLALAFLVGLYLSYLGGWPIFALGVLSLVCAVAYTGGPFPLAYHGLGDLFVFLFFGLLAVLATAWIQVTGHEFGLPVAWRLIAAAIGLQATAIIAVNNIRDIATDRAAGKNTLAVRFGERGSRIYHAALHSAAAACWWIAYAVTENPMVIAPAVISVLGGVGLSAVVFRTAGSSLNRCLALTAALELATGAALVIGAIC
jgi:1,4-dihydroxy-2-naphthoate octaprenyltransferase